MRLQGAVFVTSSFLLPILQMNRKTFLAGLVLALAAAFSAGAQCPAAGTFQLQSVNSGKVLDVTGISKDDGAVVQQWANLVGLNQQWVFLPVAGPYLGLDANGKPVIYSCANNVATLLWSAAAASSAATPAGVVIGTGASGALAFDPNSQTVDIVTAILPRKLAANSWTGANDFALIQFDPTSAAPPCAGVGDIGRVWIDNSDANNTALHYCLAVAGKVGWVAK